MASPVLNSAGTRVYVAANNRRVSAYSVETTATSASLSILWSRVIADSMGNEIRATPALSKDGGTLYVTTGKDIVAEGAGTGSLYAFVAESTGSGEERAGWAGGKSLATYALAHLAPSPVVLSDGKVVVVGGNNYGEIFGFYPDGSSAWTPQNHQGFFEGSPAVGTDDRFFLVTQTPGSGTVNSLRCYSGANGTLIWQVPLDNLSKASPVISSYGEVVVADVAGNIYGFTQDGQTASNTTGYRWKLPLTGWNAVGLSGSVTPCQTPLVDAGGNVIVSSHEGWMLSVKPDGTTRWSSAAQLPGGSLNPGIGSPVMTAKGEVLLFRETGKLFSFQNEHGPDAGIWPGFQRGANHTGSLADNPVDRSSLGYTVSYFPGTTEMRWNSYYGYYELVTNYSTVNAVNDRGHVAGYSSANSGYSTKAVEWFNGYTMVLQGPPYANDPNGSQAYGMNWRGDTVGRFGKGYYGTYGSGNAGILWERNGSGTLGQGYLLPWNTLITSGEAKALNADKWVVGNGFNSFSTKRAVLWPYVAPSSSGILPTTVNDLETLEGSGLGLWSESIGISAGKVIAGNSVAYQGGTATTRPFRLDYNNHSTINQNGAVDELPDPGAAVGTTLVRPSQWIRGINENGQIVGTVTVDTSGSSSFPTKGYIYRHSTSAALSYKVPATQLVYEDGRNNIYGVDEAVAINARGQILFKGFRFYNPNQGSGGGFTLTIERPFYLLYTPSKTGFYNVTRQVFPAGAQINGLTDDGKLYGYVYYGGLPTGFVATPNN